MENIDFATLFQGIGTMMESGWLLASARVFLVLLGLLLIYLGWKGVLEPMVMIPMGLGMVAINCGTLMMPDGTLGNLFLDPMLSDTDDLMNTMQIDFLQPVYTLTFSNGLIACFVFMGIGTLLDVGFLLQKPFASIFLALCAELGTFLTVPIASALGLTLKESASVAMVGGADGPMVLFTSLALAKHLFVPITVVAYLYLGLTYGGYPYLVKLLVPKRFRAIKMVTKKAPKNYDAKVKLAFSAVLCAVLCFLFPVASPLFFSLFLGVAVRESGMKHIYDFVSGPLLYGSTFMLGVLLGVLCDAHLLLDPKILKLLVLGIVALLLSGIGGIIGGYIMYIVKRGNYNPVIGIAAVSCVPTTAKVAQKIVSKDNPDSFVLGDALGANISGVLLGVLCDAHLLLDPKILKLLVLGIVALLLSGIGGIIGGYIMYIVKRGNYNPVIGIAAVSCVPTTAKVAQKIVSKDNPDSFVLGDALGANISGVITSAIITGIYITIIPYL